VQEAEELSVFASGPQYDRRWIKCRRPFIVTGGELALEMLDLNYNATSKIYDAPYQLKANNGIYLIDDFGRQQCTPAEILNRWIVPMERRVDYLKFMSGGKITVPFEAFLIFSTNQNPEQLGDEAFLRRIQYKMLLRSPDAQEYATIFQRFCESKNLRHPEGLIARFIDKHYRQAKRAFRRCHPRDVLSHAIDLIHFEKLPFELTDDLMDRAFDSCFLEETGD
jgi:predicted ATPase with chaperone activity